MPLSELPCQYDIEQGLEKETSDYSPERSDSRPGSRSDSRNESDIQEPYEEPTGHDAAPASRCEPLRKWQTATSTSSGGRTIIGFSPNDPENPYNWSQWKKSAIVIVGVLTVLNSTFASALPSGGIPQLANRFRIASEAQLVLPNSIYLCGYVVGPLLFAPLSESYGRQIVMISTFAGFTLFSLVVCFSPNFATYCVFRLFTGVFASSPVSVTGGCYADLYNTPISRGRAMALFMTATTWGPILSPIASGYLATYSWRWPYWCGLIVAGVSLAIVSFHPETYGPIILQRRAQLLRKQDPDADAWAPIELDKTSLREVAVKFLGRPIRMLFGEPVVGFSTLFLALMYAIFYLWFQAFPVIFPPIYGFSYGEMGLSFLGIGVGSIFACAVYLWWDWNLIRARTANKSWATSEEYRRLPLACIGGPFFTISLFWIGWSARSSVLWIVPILGGIPYGIGFLLVFMALINYMVDAYEIFAASALAAASCARSMFGVVLPFAGRPMYVKLGIAWASSLLGFVSLAMCAIPFVFIRYGPKIRAHSKFCQELAEIRKKREETEAKRLRKEARREKRAAREEEVQKEKEEV